MENLFATQLVKTSASGPRVSPPGSLQWIAETCKPVWQKSAQTPKMVWLWHQWALLGLVWFPQVLMHWDSLLQTAHKYFQMGMPKVFPFSHHHACSSDIPLWALDLTAAVEHCKAADKIHWFPKIRCDGMRNDGRTEPKSFMQATFLRTVSKGDLATSKPLRGTVSGAAACQGAAGWGRRPSQAFPRSVLLL